MSKSVRLSEKWFNKILWLIAILFAWFLIGLGSKVVQFMPKLGTPVVEEQFLDGARLNSLNTKLHGHTEALASLNEELERAKLEHQEKTNAYASTRAVYQNWLASRAVTKRSDQDPEVIERLHDLDALKDKERKAQEIVEGIDKRILDIRQQQSATEKELHQMRLAVSPKVIDARKSNELRVFLYRLLFTLPLLIAGAWLFKKHRKSAYWPFVIGFTIFTVFVFFVELVPYLPDYGGFIRYVVGIAITVVAGRYAVQALQRYREQQVLAEQKPDEARRSELSYDVALKRLSLCVCPGCERSVDLTNKELDFCPHCGIALHNNCKQCHQRKSAFSKFCLKCGTPGNTEKPSA